MPGNTPFFNLVKQEDLTAANSKLFTVPAGKQWVIKSLWAQLASTATVGNRQLRVQILDASGNEVWSGDARATQAASLTQIYNFLYLTPETAFTNSRINCAFPVEIPLPAGYQVKVFDFNNIAAGDTLSVRLVVEERSA